MTRRFHTHLVDLKNLQESDYYYEADADVGLAIEDCATWFGKRLRFRLPSSNVIWSGHLDGSSPAPGWGWSRETGDARMCLHDLLLQPAKFPPLGYPFEVGDTIEILSGNVQLGACTVMRMFDYRRQSVTVARPLS